MRRRRLASAILVVIVLAAAPAARAAFAPPIELARGDFSLGIAAATDAAGATTAILIGASGKRLLQRPSSSAPWPALTELPGDLGTPAGPVIAAAGRGAVAAAWRLDRPRRYQAIAAMAADPGGALGAPVVVSGADGNGVRHPAIAVGADGDAVLAYNTNTRAVHLSLRGGIAISLRARGRSFAAPVVVDAKPSLAPAAAIADDGRGIVAWVRDRRVWAVSVDAVAGTVGKRVPLTAGGSHDGLAVTAGPDGAATVSWSSRRRGHYEILALHRAARPATFPRTAQTVVRLRARGFLADARMAADETGATTIAWAAETFGRAPSVGVNGVTAGVYVSRLQQNTGRFARPKTLFPDAKHNCLSLNVAARAGRTAVAFECLDRRTATVYVATPRLTPVLSEPVDARAFQPAIPITLGLDTSGTTTITTIPNTPPTPSEPGTRRLLATTGR
ncbi:MAG TPA: hypothetical protein VNT55_10435 [Baekduia sp.]|nr:hypothetical protein [Baekduia sp.]